MVAAPAAIPNMKTPRPNPKNLIFLIVDSNPAPSSYRTPLNTATSSPRSQSSQHPNIPSLIPRSIHRRLCDERRMCKPLIMQQPPKHLCPNRPFPDMLMPVQLRPHRRLRIIAVPHLHRIEPPRISHHHHRLHIPI